MTDLETGASTSDLRDTELPGVSTRAVLLGLGFSLLIAVGEPYGVLVVRGSALAADFSTGAALCLYFFLVMLINPLLGLLSRSRLRRGELVTIYIMMIVAAAIPSWGFTMNLIPLMAGFSYYATTANNWSQEIIPYLPDWLVVDNAAAVQALFEGASPGESIPWDEWMLPLLAWSAFIITIYFVTICLLVILRKQWMENEKLLFPLAVLPLEMSPSDGTASPLFRNWLLWVGFGIPALLKSTVALHSYFPSIPAVTLKTSTMIFSESIKVPLTPHFEVIGLSYLLSLDVSFSVWFFTLLAMVMTGVMRLLGWSIGPTQAFSDPSPPSIAHFAIGALFFLVISSFWSARSHLKDVVGKALGRRPHVDDSQELLSYRTALFGSVIGTVLAGVWLYATGLNLQGTVVFLLSSLVIYIGVARIISQTGLAYARAAVAAPVFTANALGSSALGPAGLSALGLSFAWAADLRTFVMASTATGLKMAREVGIEHRRLLWAVIAAIVVSLAGSMWVVLVLAYDHGGNNIGTWQFQGLPSYTGGWVLANIANPQPAQAWHLGFTGVGATGMAIMTYLKNRFIGFPIHPIGMALGLTWPLYNVWFSICLAWLLKAAIVKYYGSRGYVILRPLFLGLVLGSFVTTGIWWMIDGLTGMSGNVLTYF
jgi:hypothetical protein